MGKSCFQNVFTGVLRRLFFRQGMAPAHFLVQAAAGPCVPIFGVISSLIPLGTAPVGPPLRVDVSSHFTFYENGFCIIPPGAAQEDLCNTLGCSKFTLPENKTERFALRGTGRRDV